MPGGFVHAAGGFSNGHFQDLLVGQGAGLHKADLTLVQLLFSLLTTQQFHFSMLHRQSSSRLTSCM